MGGESFCKRILMVPYNCNNTKCEIRKDLIKNLFTNEIIENFFHEIFMDGSHNFDAVFLRRGFYLFIFQ